MKILIDMNLSPDWCSWFKQRGVESEHWSKVGQLNATDATIMEWARQNECVVFTHDFDYGALLASSHEGSPSIIQLRMNDVSPQVAGDCVLDAIRNFEKQLVDGTLITIDENKSRIRLLPLK